MPRLALFAAVFVAGAWVGRGGTSSVDEDFVFAAAESLATDGSWRLREPLGGREHSRFSPLPSLLMAPAVKVAAWCGGDRAARIFAAGLASCGLAAGTAVLLFGFLRPWAGAGPALAAAFASVFATPALAYAPSVFHQNLAT